MKEKNLMILDMEKENIYIKMEVFILDFGKMEICMDQV